MPVKGATSSGVAMQHAPTALAGWPQKRMRFCSSTQYQRIIVSFWKRSISVMSDALLLHHHQQQQQQQNEKEQHQQYE